VDTPLGKGAPTMLFSRLEQGVVTKQALSKGETLLSWCERGVIGFKTVVILGPSGAGNTRKIFAAVGEARLLPDVALAQ